jgi:hypothetical protein
VDKDRILNFTTVLDGLNKSELADEFINHLEDCIASDKLSPKIASRQINLKNQVKNIGIDSLYKECNIVTSGWLDRFKRKWDRGNSPESQPDINWESVLKIVNKSMDGDLRQMNNMTKSMGKEWESLRANHQYLREKAGEISSKYTEAKNSIINSFPEHKDLLQNKYFKHLDGKFTLLNDIMVNEQPSASLLSEAYNFTKEITQILRRNDNAEVETSDAPTGLEQRQLLNNQEQQSSEPSLNNEDTSMSMPLGDQELLNEAWDNYWNMSKQFRQTYLNNLKNNDPLIGNYLQSWVEQYG